MFYGFQSCRREIFTRFLLPLWVFIIVSLYVYVYSGLSRRNISELNLSPTFMDFKIGNPSKAISKEHPEPKKVLIWNTYWKSKSLWRKVFGRIITGKCGVSNCIFTLDKNELGSSDAVLFHIVDLSLYPNLPPPIHRPHSQVWIGMTYEPPFILTHAGLNLSTLDGLFNRTMSYRRDSDIVIRHGNFIRINDQFQNSTKPYSSSSSSSQLNWINSRDDPKIRNYAIGKRRLVAWFASARNCTSQSGREKYVEQLQRHVQVDVYGSCGKFKCGKSRTLRRPYAVEEDECYFLVSVAYKFVLAFENSICEDYVTEKLYNNLKLNVVPIVFGGGNYSVYAPPHSVIDASEYSPEELGEYLQRLDSNDTLYNAYFSWKKDFYIESQDGVPDPCELCTNLHRPAIYRQHTYDQFDRWIRRGCREGYGGFP